nr:uncharacterized protein LOC111517770 [Leptinotarsa decemlineata]
MNTNTIIFKILVIIILYFITHSNALQRCFLCRSRGELGSCKDSFSVNVTKVENKQEIGIETIPCASGWCGKIVESENSAKEEYGVATQRICLQRGPSDSEDRCAYTKWNYKRVLMCFCKGDLCNSSPGIKVNQSLLFSLVVIFFMRLIY